VRVSDTSLTVYRLDFDIERYRHLGFDCDDPPLHLYALEPRAGAEWPSREFARGERLQRIPTCGNWLGHSRLSCAEQLPTNWLIF
jgi:hypothetical protein